MPPGFASRVLTNLLLPCLLIISRNPRLSASLADRRRIEESSRSNSRRESCKQAHGHCHSNLVREREEQRGARLTRCRLSRWRWRHRRRARGGRGRSHSRCLPARAPAPAEPPTRPPSRSQQPSATRRCFLTSALGNAGGGDCVPRHGGASLARRRVVNRALTEYPPSLETSTKISSSVAHHPALRKRAFFPAPADRASKESPESAEPRRAA